MTKFIDTLHPQPRKCRHLTDAQFHLRNAERSLEAAQADTPFRSVHDMAQEMAGEVRRQIYRIEKTTRRKKR